MSLIEILTRGNEEEIAPALKQRMRENIHFFSSYLPKLSLAIQESPKEYNLLFDSRGLNVVNLKDHSLLFPTTDGRHMMLEAAKNLSENPLTHPHWKLYTNNQKLHWMSEEDFPKTGHLNNELIKRTMATQIPQGGMHLPHRFLPQTTLLGLGGGLHLEYLRERYPKIHSLIIFEESLDLFRISCYFVDYAALFSQVSEGACYIFVESLVDRAWVKSFFEVRRITANFLRLELTLYETPKITAVREVIQEAQGVNARGWGTFEDEMVGLKNSLENILYEQPHQRYPILLNPRRLNAPICVVGNGPSLDRLLPFIKKNAARMIILSSGTALKPLLNYGIRPDFQVEIERVDYLHQVLEESPLGTIPLLSGTMVNPKALHLAKEAYLFQRGGSSICHLHAPEFIVAFSSPFVGNAAFALASLFGSDVLIAGLDCGYIEGERKHAKDSFYGEEMAEIPQGAWMIRGNKNRAVYTDSIFALSRENLEHAIKVLSPQSVLNLGEGAYIEGARPTDVEEFDLRIIDKEAAIGEFKASFSQETKALFSKQNAHFHLDEWQEIMGNFENFFLRSIKGKAELFDWIDEVFAYMAQTSKKMPFTGTLLGGTLSHFLQTLLLCAMQTPTDEVGFLLEEAHELVMQGLEGLHQEYAQAILEHRLKNGTKIA